VLADDHAAVGGNRASAEEGAGSRDAEGLVAARWRPPERLPSSDPWHDLLAAKMVQIHT
jgi:hypothetical protein